MNIEEQIRRAMEEGQFKDLPGKGKPLKLEENPFEDPEWRLANKILRDNGFTLPWIESRKEIENELAEARKALGLAWAASPSEQVDRKWKLALQAFQDKITDLNRKIFTYNLEVPSLLLQMAPYCFEKELESVKNESAGRDQATKGSEKT